jgi:predicted anti-sigma-YlaC factor YlaD
MRSLLRSPALLILAVAAISAVSACSDTSALTSPAMSATSMSGSRAATPASLAVASISVSPSIATGAAGVQQQFTAVAYDAKGHKVKDTFTFTSSDSTVISIDPVTGFASFGAMGTATITATDRSGVTGTAQVTSRLGA